jgi:DNA-binding transcriptional LysR family regulator
MVIALPAGHSLARVAMAIALRDLGRETFITFARQTGPAFFEATTAACRQAGFSPALGPEASRITSALNLVAAGFGICVVPFSVSRMRMEGIVFRQLKGPVRPTAPINIVSRRNDSAAAVRNFLIQVQKVKAVTVQK